MPKLPKKSTMKEVINRTQNYIYKLWSAGKLTVKDVDTFDKLKKKIFKAIDNK